MIPKQTFVFSVSAIASPQNIVPHRINADTIGYLYYIVDDNHGHAQNQQNRTCHISHNPALDLIGKLRADKGEEGGNHNGKRKC